MPVYNNPNTFAGLVGKVRRNQLTLRKEEGREGGEKKRAQRARRTRGSNPGPAGMTQAIFRPLRCSRHGGTV